jgi:hypothetical protein
VTIAADHTESFVLLAFDRMMVKARSLAGEDRLCDCPDIDGANSVYALITHCVGVTDFWLDHVVLGNETARDRDAEFTAVGTLGDLEDVVDALRDRLPGLTVLVAAAEEPADDEYADLAQWPWSVDTIVLHVIEELFQHAGHVDLTCDALTQG